MREQEQRKISFQGIIKSVQPRSTVWRYRLDNRTHRTVGYNIFLTGISYRTLAAKSPHSWGKTGKIPPWGVENQLYPR